jgi:hypothetical protein
MEGNLFITFHLKTEIYHGGGEKQHPNVSFFRNIACFDLLCFFMLCNVYSVLDEKRQYTKTGIKERDERAVCVRGG